MTASAVTFGRIAPIADRALQVAVGLAGAVAALSVLTIGAAHASGFRVNTTESMPLGVWRLSPADRAERGDTVWVCPPNRSEIREARRFGFIPHGFCPGGFAPLLKPIAAVPGDAVGVSAAGITVNGRMIPNSAPAALDAQGRNLPRIPHRTFTVGVGQVWLVSDYHPASFDSRYFGPVPTDHVVARAAPFATRDAR